MSLRTMLKQLIVLLLCSLAGVVTAAAQDVETTLKQYEGKILVLRHPLHDDSQSYDADGKILKGGQEESWTSHGGVLIDHVTIAPDKLHFEGARILFAFHEKLVLTKMKKRKESQWEPASSSPKVDITITLDHVIDSADKATSVLDHVFALSNQDLLVSLPEIWFPYMKAHVVYDPSQERDKEFLWKEVKPDDKTSVQDPPTAAIESGDGHIYHVGPEVKAPKATHTPEPAYSDAARYEKYQGAAVLNFVVGTDGNVHRIKLVRPLGLGLDENAVAAVQTWRFKPATRNGEPVAVEMNVEVSFSLY